MPHILAPKLVETWGQQLVVDNRGGAAGNIGTEIAARAPADGYTLLLAALTHVINPSLYKNLSFDFVKDFAPITLMVSTPSVLLLNPSVPANSVKELIALAKAKPSQLNFGSAGSGSSSHLAAELFSSMAGIKMTHVLYRVTSVVLIDLIAGRIEVYFNTLPSAMPHVRAKKLKVLAVTSLKRTLLLPDMPTVSEAGVPGYEMTAWYGVLTRDGVPQDIIQKLNADFVRTIRIPEVSEKLIEVGAEPVANTPEQFKAFIQSELKKWAKVVQESGAKVDY
ncbi:MAG: tripartite tricarboxylate transporter substrate binding protein [Betaproteobacteria bacterium]|nr:tripartite tricarboxylate transporter substrate binding protein [Betaproteobacteria bacterium]